ncbi:MAG: CsbD family protein [Betaproteobacteria bacterium]
MWNKTEREGTADQAKGKIKQAVAAVTDDKDLKAEGETDEAVGKVKSAVGEISRKAGDAISKVGNAVKR